jgi:hypothetical protein
VDAHIGSLRRQLADVLQVFAQLVTQLSELCLAGVFQAEGERLQHTTERLQHTQLKAYNTQQNTHNTHTQHLQHTTQHLQHTTEHIQHTQQNAYNTQDFHGTPAAMNSCHCGTKNNPFKILHSLPNRIFYLISKFK